MPVINRNPPPDHIILTVGAHEPGKGLCLLEACAYVKGEAHSDHPTCVHPVLAAFGRVLNDAAWSSDEARDAALSPLIPFMLDTVNTLDEAKAVRCMVLWAARVAAPLALRRVGLRAASNDLVSLKDDASYEEIRTAADAAYAADAASAAYAAGAAYAADAAYATARATAYAANAANVASAVNAARAADAAARDDGILQQAAQCLRECCGMVKAA